MGSETITISRNQMAMVVAAIAIITFAWNIASDYNARGAKIDRLEYQLSLGEAKTRGIEQKYDSLVAALNEQKVEFARLRSELRQRNERPQ